MMILLIYTFYQILALSRTGQATLTAPIEPLLSAAAGNRTILNTQISQPWDSGPGVRGTSDILWSCLLTLTSCVYTSIHLNVPPAGEGKLQRLRRKLTWVAMALFAPELVLYCALNQFLAARKLVKELNNLWDTTEYFLSLSALLDFGGPLSKSLLTYTFILIIIIDLISFCYI